jgi:CheY-like chemotaxis protein
MTSSIVEKDRFMKSAPRAIVIDDDPSCRALLELLLKKKGYEVISLSRPCLCPLFGEVECSCSRDHFCGDFLLTDNRMPGMTGLEFVERQTGGACKGIFAHKAVLSGSWSQEELARAERLGCQVFDKPFKLREILAWLDEREKKIQAGRKLVSLNPDYS